MKKIILSALLVLASITSSFSQTYVQGYTRSDGIYVSGHYRSERNSTNHDNYGTSGNTNPYTGERGRVARDYSTEASSYGDRRTIYTGTQGGQYYVNSSGNKTYVPKQSQTTGTNSRSSTSSYYSTMRGW